MNTVEVLNASSVANYLRDLEDQDNYDRLVEIRNDSDIDDYVVVANSPSDLFEDCDKSEIISILEDCLYVSDDEYAVLCEGRFEKTISRDDFFYGWFDPDQLAEHIVENDLFEACGIDKEHILANY